MKNRQQWIAIALVLFLAQAFWGNSVVRPKWKQNYAPQQTSLAEGLAPDQLIATLAGFREMIAGILWVRADAFFDNGNYDAILPIIRLVTWLDPKQIDVYTVGMWHIAYNFTDEEQRSDRRYIPAALALGSEGAKRNPETYELFFETGWTWYNKVDDNYDKAVSWFEQAQQRKDIETIAARKNILANAYLKEGNIDKALETYLNLQDKAFEVMKKDDAFGNRQNAETLEGNIDTLIVRMSQRGYFGRKNGDTPPAPYDTDPPFDVGFSVKATIPESRILQMEGSWNVLPVGTRIRVVLRDAEFPNAIKGGVNWDQGLSGVVLDPPRDQTYCQDQLYVKNRRFNKKINMSGDPTMYPFASKKYILEFYYNPRSAPPHIQDKFSWSGEGMTDKNFLNTDIRPGTRCIYTSFEVTQDQILRRGEWLDKVPSFATPNYLSSDAPGLNKEFIKVPGILSEPPK